MDPRLRTYGVLQKLSDLNTLGRAHPDHNFQQEPTHIKHNVN
jgi:hypothetical protein